MDRATLRAGSFGQHLAFSSQASESRLPSLFGNAARGDMRHGCRRNNINAIGKQRLVLCGLWTSVCIVGPALSALDQGFEVYVIDDSCGDVSAEAHDRALDRMLQAGAQPMPSLQYLLDCNATGAGRRPAI